MIILFFFLSFWLGLAFRYAIWLCLAISLVFLFFVFKRLHLKMMLICAGIILSGVSFSFVSFSYTKNQYDGIVYQAKDNYFLLNSGGERLYVYQKGHSYDIGDILSITGTKEDLSFNTIESSFDFKDYLNKRGIYHALKVNKINVKFHNFIRINQRRDKLLSQFDEEERSIVGAILFSYGEDSDLSNDLKELHLARFLSASGLYVSIFVSIFDFLFSLFMKDKYAELVTIGIIGLYTIFTFPRFSILKIFLLIVIKWINKYLLKKKFSYLTILSSFGIFCLLINRYLAVQDSFILGFSIPLISYLTRSLGGKKKIKPKIYRYLLIYLFFIPFEAHYYNKIVILSLPMQIIASPLFLLIGFISLLCFFYIPLYQVDKFLIDILKWFVSFIKYASFGFLLPDFPEIIYFIYYLTYFIYTYYLMIGFTPIHRFLMIGKIAFLIIYALPINNMISAEVSFVNVGQGDCTLVRYHQHTTLIDTGGLTSMDVATSSLIPYLKKKRIYQIDAVLISHYDYDHYGALESLKKHYQVNAIYDYASSFPVKVDQLTFYNYNYYAREGAEENEKSLVIGFQMQKTHFVIMGDATSYIERQIVQNEIKMDCDILRVGHHGSNTSSCLEFIQYLKPETAIISVGKNNKYGHPHHEVLINLKRCNVNIRRTDIEGTITYRFMFI